MLEDKHIIDKHFQYNWAATPIQYDGANFTAPQDGRWISVRLIPYDRQSMSANHGLKVDYALIKVYCYDTSTTKCYNLARAVQTFLECKNIPTDTRNEIIVGVGVPSGDGATPLDNSVYETVLDFTVRKYT